MRKPSPCTHSNRHRWKLEGDIRVLPIPNKQNYCGVRHLFKCQYCGALKRVFYDVKRYR